MKDLEIKRSCWFIWVYPKCNHKCSHKREAQERFDTETEGEKAM